jgi:predicted RNase H-like HicB family nuclease
VRQVLLYTDEDGIWIAECPSLPGCGGDGTTREEAIERVKEAIRSYVEALEADGLPDPEEYPNLELVTHVTQRGGQVALDVR